MEGTPTALPLFSPYVYMFEQETEWFITKWDEGVGMAVQVFTSFIWMKGMRLDDSLS